MLKLNLKKNETRFKNVENDLLALFFSSATSKSNKTFRFAKVDNNLTAFLPYLTDGAVKLYLYYALAANNDTGESWHSIDKISQKLGTTERSISNWNHQLEDLGLIYRTSTGKKSKATFVLPLTGFALKMSIQQIEQAIRELDLYHAGVYTKIFGKVQSLTKLYIKGEVPDSVNEILCVHLQKRTVVNSVEVNCVDAFIYNISAADEETAKKFRDFESEVKVAIVNGEKEITLGSKTPAPLTCFFINDAPKIDDTAIYEIMSQLTDDVDLSDLPQITI